MVLLDDVVQIFGLPQCNIKASIFIDAFDGGRVGPAFVDGNFLGQIVQIDGVLQVSVTLSSLSFTLGSVFHVLHFQSSVLR